MHCAVYIVFRDCTLITLHIASVINSVDKKERSVFLTANTI